LVEHVLGKDEVTSSNLVMGSSIKNIRSKVAGVFLLFKEVKNGKGKICKD
jgi:hypothetical protein